MAKKITNPVGDLSKTGLAEHLAERMDLPRSLAVDAVETIFDLIANHVAQGGRVSVTNFGGWSRVRRQPRKARNPQTGNIIDVPAKLDVDFTPSPRLLAFANSDDPSQTTIRKAPKRPTSRVVAQADS